MARFIPWLYEALCLLIGITLFTVLQGSSSDAQQLPVAKPVASTPISPVVQQLSETPSTSIPASLSNLTDEQQKAVQKIRIAKISQPQIKSEPGIINQEPQPSSFSQGGKCKWEKSFLSTAYGPPWDAIEGGPETATGKALKEGRYYVAIDRSVIPMGSQMRIWPNPHNYRGLFTAEDVGGAIKGNHVDIFVWQGRSVRDVWKKNVKVCLVRSGR